MQETLKVAIIAFTDKGLVLGQTIQKEFHRSKLFTSRETEGRDVVKIGSVAELLEKKFYSYDAWIFVGALGICVRSIAPFLNDKSTDPAVVNIDEQGLFAQAVLSGHIGGANEIAQKLSCICQGQAVISTSSDLQNIWSLDLLASKWNWTAVAKPGMNEVISLFVNNKKTALVLKVKDAGTAYLEKTKPSFVDIFYSLEEVLKEGYELVIYVGYETIFCTVPSICFYPKCIAIGSGCRKEIEADLFETALLHQLEKENVAVESIAALCSVDVKKEEGAYLALCQKHGWDFTTYPVEELKYVAVANPSAKVMEKLGVEGVSESSAALYANNSRWLVEKTKIEVTSGKAFTYALSLMSAYQRKGLIAIVGAGPGAPELITLQGKELLERADCILYAGSLVPEELTHFAKAGALVRNSASLTLEEQMEIVDDFYAQGKIIVRLHSGDPSIYGAIQEQMTQFDAKQYDYFIVPGISSFQAAAAYLKSEFTVPEVAQTIVLTRGEGNTPMPEHEKIEDMAKLRATMCIFLSAGIVKKVEGQLLQHYPEETPVAVLYRVSWKDEQVWTGKLSELAEIVKENKLSRTVLIIVGEAIGARKNRSWLYGDNWYHIFRKKDKPKAIAE